MVESWNILNIFKMGIERMQENQEVFGREQENGSEAMTVSATILLNGRAGGWNKLANTCFICH